MLHPLEQVRDHQNPLADTPALAACQAAQLCRPRCAAKEVCRHRPSPKCGTHAQSLYHISEPLEAGIRGSIERKRTAAFAFCRWTIRLVAFSSSTETPN